ncbi:MAG: ATP-binding cassette domain-containing protein [Clostridiales bacterium]|nr:ATP-binding cassette domain-containing protein [Clostridiales bacterium]
MMINMEHVQKHFLLNGQRILVLEDITLQVKEGEFVALLGPSGCGKSTLLSLLAGYFPPDKGSIKLTGRLGYMPQRDMLLPWLTIVENACLPVAVNPKADLAAARDKVAGLLPLFGLTGFGGSLPGQLSGGMKQRAALLRTYMMGGDFWLLDEPFGSLDTLTKESLQEWFINLHREIKSGLLFVTHDITEAINLAKRIYALSPRPGRIIGEWQVEEEISLKGRIGLKKEILAVLGGQNNKIRQIAH